MSNLCLLCIRISNKRTEQLGEAEQVKQNVLDVRCLQVSDTNNDDIVTLSV